MAKARTIVQQRMCVQMESYPNYLTKILYDEYQLGNSCDLVIKTGPEKHQSYCHKMVLAFSSDYLRDILSTVPSGTTPVLLLPDIDTDIIDYLMVFIYTGQVKIPTEKYADFVDACKELQLKGMTYNGDDEQEMIEDQLEEGEQVHESLIEEEIDHNMDEVDEFSIHYIDEEDTDVYDDVLEESSIPEPASPLSRKGRLKTDVYNTTIPKVFRMPNSPTGQPKKQSKMVLREPHQKIILNDSNITAIREKLIAAILNVYKNMNMKLKDVQLVVKDDRLQKGLYQCSLCSKMISVVYTVDKNGKFRQWVNSNLKRHISRTHCKDT